VKHSNIIYEKSRFFHAWSTWSNVQEMCIKDFIFVQGIFREKPLRFFLFLNQPIIFPYPSRMHNKYYLILLENRNSQSIFTSRHINMLRRYHGTKFTEFLLINTYQWYANEGSLKSAFALTQLQYILKYFVINFPCFSINTKDLCKVYVHALLFMFFHIIL
jgi:hypothetical protein